MTVKEFLKKGQNLNDEINADVQALVKLRALVYGTAARYDNVRVQTSPGNTQENNIIKLIDLENKINAKIDRLIDYQSKMHDLINSVDNTRYRALLTERYINCKTWEEIAAEFNVDLRWIYRLHGRALAEIPYKEAVEIMNE